MAALGEGLVRAAAVRRVGGSVTVLRVVLVKRETVRVWVEKSTLEVMSCQKLRSWLANLQWVSVSMCAANTALILRMATYVGMMPG